MDWKVNYRKSSPLTHLPSLFFPFCFKTRTKPNYNTVHWFLKDTCCKTVFWPMFKCSHAHLHALAQTSYLPWQTLNPCRNDHGFHSWWWWCKIYRCWQYLTCANWRRPRFICIACIDRFVGARARVNLLIVIGLSDLDLSNQIYILFTQTNFWISSEGKHHHNWEREF